MEYSEAKKKKLMDRRVARKNKKEYYDEILMETKVSKVKADKYSS